MNTERDLTAAWRYYELGRAYNNSLSPNQYRTVNTNIEFFAGNQWLHIPDSPAMAKLAKPVFNIIKRVTSLFVASLTSSSVTVSFEPLSYYGGESNSDPKTNAAVYATAEARNLLEKFKMDYRIREALFDGAQTGDYCAHFYWNPEAVPYGGAFGEYRGEIEMELVDGINVMFGNPNTPDVEKQPYILIVGRDTVENLKNEAALHAARKAKHGGKSVSTAEITPDADREEQSGLGGRTEISGDDDKTGKALYVYYYTKVPKREKVTDPETGLPKRVPVLNERGEPIPLKDEKGNSLTDEKGEPVYKTRELTRSVTTVHVTKATKNANIFEDVDTGLTHYPIAWGNWEKQKNQYHGRALVTGIVPNQIFINSMMAMIFRHLQLQSFPKTVYNADLISRWNNEVGTALGVRGLQPGQDLRSVASVLQPADMSNQIVMAIDKVMEYTRDCLGATDAQMGRVQPDNTSALMVLQSSSEVPLENTRAGLYEWMEDIARILLDMMGTYYGRRPLVRDREFKVYEKDGNGEFITDPVTKSPRLKTVTRRITEEFDFSQFKHLWFNVAVDVGASTYYSEIAMVQTLDNLRRDGTLDIISYLERIPDKLIPRKAELIDCLRQRSGLAGETVSAAEGGSVMGGPLDAGKAIARLPAGIQGKYASLPKAAQRALVARAGMV